MELDFVVPDHGGACVSSIVPSVVAGQPGPAVGRDVVDASAVVLLVVDGLGWHQLRRYQEHAPVMASAPATRISTVAPSTTATALTSITTGTAPGEHGVVGYRVKTAAGVLNCLRWTAAGRDATDAVPPADFQPIDPFLGSRPPVVTRAEFAHTGFTDAHLRDGGWFGWYTPFTMVTQILDRVADGARFVYAYYDGLDKVGHVHGIGRHYFDELEFIDALVARIAARLPDGATLLVTADHGMVDVGPALVKVNDDALACTASSSGEARFMWLHAKQGAAPDLLDAASAHGDVGWVVPLERVLDERWFGPVVAHEARIRLGDVALVAREPIAFVEPGSPDSPWLVGRHGGLTAEEMHVPLLQLAGQA